MLVRLQEAFEKAGILFIDEDEAGGYGCGWRKGKGADESAADLRFPSRRVR
jgi:hypothetical protein